MVTKQIHISGSWSESLKNNQSSSSKYQKTNLKQKEMSLSDICKVFVSPPPRCTCSLAMKELFSNTAHSLHQSCKLQTLVTFISFLNLMILKTQVGACNKMMHILLWPVFFCLRPYHSFPVFLVPITSLTFSAHHHPGLPPAPPTTAIAMVAVSQWIFLLQKSVFRLFTVHPPCTVDSKWITAYKYNKTIKTV